MTTESAVLAALGSLLDPLREEGFSWSLRGECLLFARPYHQRYIAVRSLLDAPDALEYAQEALVGM